MSVEDSVEVSLPMGMLDHLDMIAEISFSVTVGEGLVVEIELKAFFNCTAAPASSSKSIALSGRNLSVTYRSLNLTAANKLSGVYLTP